MKSLVQITHSKLKIRLRKGAVRFYFRKVGGELRIALGTLDLSRVPSKKRPKGGTGPNNCTSYYDLEKKHWRAISRTQEIWIN